MNVKEWYSEGTEQTKAAKKFATVLAVIAFLAVSASVIGLAVTGAFNLIVLGILAFVGIVGIQLAPWASRLLTLKGKNFLLKKMKSEVESNPIETRQQVWISEGEELKRAEQTLASTAAEVLSFADMVRNTEKDYPDQVDDLKAALVDQQSAVHMQTELLAKAKSSHAAKGRVNKLLDIKWKAAISNKRIMASLGGDPDSVLKKLLEETAAYAVDKSFNESIAALRIAQATAVKPPSGVKQIEGETITVIPTKLRAEYETARPSRGKEA